MKDLAWSVTGAEVPKGSQALAGPRETLHGLKAVQDDALKTSGYWKMQPLTMIP